MSEDLIWSVGRRIREVRRGRGHTQEGLAEALGIATKNLQRIESGKQNLTLRTLQHVAAVLEVSAGDLVEPVGSPYTGQRLERQPMGLKLSEERPDSKHVPVYDLLASAGRFAAGESPERMGWITVSPYPTAGAFVARVVGDSMEPRVPDGSWCLFRAPVAAPFVGKFTLVQHHGIADPDTGGSFALKKVAALDRSEDGTTRVRLASLNRRYRDIEFELAQDEALRPLAELVTVLGISEATNDSTA